jgi:hypothetical protein
MSIRQFEIAIGASNGVISNAIKNKTDIRANWISIIIEKFPDINVDWLISGKEPMSRVGLQSDRNENFIDLFSKQMNIELDAIKSRLDKLEGKK